MKKIAILFLLTFLLAPAAEAQWRGGLFRWYVSGTATPVTDSLRFKFTGAVTGALSGRELTINSTVAAGTVDSVAIVNASVAATDLVDASILNAKIAPSAVDSTKIKASHVTSTDIKDGEVLTADLAASAVTSAKIATLTGFLTQPDMIEFLGGALKETAASGASDTTQNYMPLKNFSVGDTATFDFSTSKRFVSLDSIVVIAYSNNATSAVVFNCQIRQVQIGGTIAGAFNASSAKTITTSTAGTLRQWSFTSFGSVTAAVYSHIVGKIYRTAGGTGGDIPVERVLIYGVGLR